jgi:hypothetical protein
MIDDITVGANIITTDFLLLFTRFNNHISKILRFLAKFIDLYIPYAMKLLILITLGPGFHLMVAYKIGTS